jgi:hypothetical protein
LKKFQYTLLNTMVAHTRIELIFCG